MNKVKCVYGINSGFSSPYHEKNLTLSCRIEYITSKSCIVPQWAQSSNVAERCRRDKNYN